MPHCSLLEVVDILAIPLLIHATLQTLEICGASFLVPPRAAMLPRTSSSPLSISTRASGGLNVFLAILLSPAATAWSYEWMRKDVIWYLHSSLPPALQFAGEVRSSIVQPLSWLHGRLHSVAEMITALRRPIRSDSVVETVAEPGQTQILRRARPLGDHEQTIVMQEGTVAATAEGFHGQFVATDGSAARASSVDRSQAWIVGTIQTGEDEHTVEGDSGLIVNVREEQHEHGLIGDLQTIEYYPLNFPQTVVDIAYLSDSLNSHIARLLGNAVMMPLRMLLLQHLVGSFRLASYSWSRSSRNDFWFPGSRKDALTFGGRILFSCGLECATRVALWMGEVSIVAWRRRRQQQRQQQQQQQH